MAEFPLVLDTIGRLDGHAAEAEVRLNPFTYASALAVLAQWILANGLSGSYRFVDCAAEMRRYLDDVRFEEALQNPEIVISPDPMDWAVGLTRINRAQPTEKVTEKIVEILETFINPVPQDREALTVLIAEMIENVHKHANAQVDGFAVAQVYPERLKMGVALVDAGIGVKASFLSGDPSVPIAELRTDEDFLREAVKLHSTSKRQGHSGYGLYLLSELIGRNRGTFLLASGGCSLVGYRRQRKTVFDAYHHAPWRGTIVSVILDLNQRLPLSDIYREMPTLPDLETDDIFVA